MSELRFNLVTRDWVIIAPERAKRPEDIIKKMGREIYCHLIRTTAHSVQVMST